MKLQKGFMKQNLGNWISEQRESKGLSRKDLVEEAAKYDKGLSYVYLSKIETGERELRTVNMEVREGLRKALDIDKATWTAVTGLAVPLVVSLESDQVKSDKFTAGVNVSYLSSIDKWDAYVEDKANVEVTTLGRHFFGEVLPEKQVIIKVTSELFFDYEFLQGIIPGFILVARYISPYKWDRVLFRRFENQQVIYGIRKFSQSKTMVYRNVENDYLYLLESENDEILGVYISMIEKPDRLGRK